MMDEMDGGREKLRGRRKFLYLRRDNPTYPPLGHEVKV